MSRMINGTLAIAFITLPALVLAQNKTKATGKDSFSVSVEHIAGARQRVNLSIRSNSQKKSALLVPHSGEKLARR